MTAKAFYDTCFAQWKNISQRESIIQHDLSIAGFHLRIHLATPYLDELMMPALHHAYKDKQGSSSPDLTLYCWDAKTTNLPPLQAPQHVDQINGRGEMLALNDDRYRASYQPGAQVINLLNTQTNIGLCWFPDAHSIPQYIRSAPFFPIFHWFFESKQHLLTHAAAVSTSKQQAALIMGASGKGKSTTALVAQQYGLTHISDDYCLVNPSSCEVYSLYRAMKIIRHHRPDGLKQLSLPPEATCIGRPDKEKSLHFLSPTQQSAAISCILLPHIGSSSQTATTPISGGDALRQTATTPISGGDALRQLAPTTVLQLPGASRQALASLSQVIRKRPCFNLALGSNMDTIAPTIEEIIHANAHKN